MLSIAINVLLTIHVLVSLLIILLVLMQRPKNEGLGAAFGGGMTENLFGAQTTNVLQTFTRYLGALFFSLTLLLSWLYVKQTTQRNSVHQRLLAPTVVPAAPATPAPDNKLPAPLPIRATEKPAQPTAPAKPAGPAPSTEAPKTLPSPPPPKPVPPAANKPADEAKPAPAPAIPKPESPAPAKPAAVAPPAAEKPAAPPAAPPAQTPPAPEKTPEKPAN